MLVVLGLFVLMLWLCWLGEVIYGLFVFGVVVWMVCNLYFYVSLLVLLVV